MIQLSKVNRIYVTSKTNQVQALKEIDITMHPNEMTAIIGASGSGKSTLMNIIGGLDGEYEGLVTYSGCVLNKADASQLADYRKDNIGFVFQHFHLISHLTVLENVMLALSMTDMSQDIKNTKCRDMIDQVGLTQVIDQKGNELSGGQKQRVAIARALVKDPSIILADEPTGALDTKTSQEIIDLLKSIATKRRMVIVITHDKDVARKSDRCVTLADGEIVSDEYISERPAVENVSERPARSARKSSYMEAIQLSLRRIKYNKWRYFLVSIGGVVGLLGLLMAFMLSQGVNEYVEESYEKIVDNRKVVVLKEGDYIDDNTYFDLQKNDLIDYIQREHKINAVFSKGDEQIKFNVTPLQKERNRQGHAKPNILYGQLPKDGETSIAINESLAQKLVQPGQAIDSLIGDTFTAKYLSPDQVSNYPARWDEQTFVISGITENAFIGTEYSYVSFGTHEDIVRRSRFITKGDVIDSNELTIYLKESSHVSEIVKVLEGNYNVTTPEDQIKSLTTTFSLLKIGILGVSIVILLIASIMVGIILFISVLERRNEIGVLKALGGRRREIRWIFFAEGGLVGVFAAGLAIMIGTIIYGVIHLLDKEMLIQLFRPSVWGYVSVFVIGLVTHLMATVIPANKASAFDPVELLRD